MNINELDSYNLGDAVKFNDQLNPRLWGADEQLRPEVREQLLRIADDFREFLGIDIEVDDITISGSNAAYTYTPHSDIDLHLVVDLPQADENEVYRELFDAKKYAYNDQHDITIGGYDVELYVQDARKQHHSQGIYSVMNDAWVSVPKRRKPDVDDISVRSKFEDLGHRIESAIATGDYEQIAAMANRVKEYRQAGLDQHGEFGPENLAFKILRKQGLIEKLYSARAAAKDQDLSLDERKKKKKKSVRYGYGGYWYPGTGYAGQDHPAGTEGSGDGGGGESVREDAGMTWDGVNPSTDMFTSEDAGMTPSGVSPTTAMFTTETDAESDEQILQDFVKFCVNQLDIKRMPRVKLRRDPEWCRRNRTFGRYNDDAEMLEVAWGNRHIMDVLRTVAHELTHKHQHEREAVPADAGETGSQYENEANAQAGILMRAWAQEHPEHFAAGSVDIEEQLEENLKSTAGTVAVLTCLLAGGGLTGCATAPQQSTQQILRTTQDVGRTVQAARNITRAGTEAEVQQEIRTLARVLGGRTEEANNSQILRIWQRIKSQQPQQQNESASGYIPTKRQAKDPRYSMALTVDIKPGQVGKEANKLGLKTNKQGQPQIARASGLFEKLALELAQFKKKLTLAEDLEQLDEVAMSPGALAKWANSDAAQGIRAGFEAELIFRDTTNDDDEDEYDMEPDYDYDERARSVSSVIDFFQGGDYGGLSDRQESRLEDGLNEKYYEWYDERMRDAFDEEAEDLVRKVIEEEDWDLDNEIQKQLELLDLPTDEFNAIIQAGELAPRFTRVSDQQAYIKENPLYQKYLDAQTEAEDLLDTLVEDSVRAQDKYYDAALDEFRENFTIDDDSDFFSDVGLSYMSDIASEYSLDWPYLTGGGGGNNGGSREWENIGDSLQDAIDMPVRVSQGYHSMPRKEGQWIVEPDSSLSPDDREDYGLEIVSPPMPLLTALEQLQAVTDWANSDAGNAYTNSSTGLHMGVSVPYKGGDVDYVKLILFLGDEYVLQSFGREANTYTKSAMSKFRENIRGGRADPAGAMQLMRSNLIEFAYREIQKGVGTGKYTSAHIQDGYIEFRSAGGDWLAEGDAEPGKLENTMLRYARAMQLAANPAEERQEYAKKLYKLVAPEGDSQLALFSQFAAGELTAEQLKKRWAEKTIGTERKMNQRWKLYDRATGEPVPGQEYNGYTEEEARARAKGKISPGSSDRDFDSAYELRNIGQDQQWEIYSVDTGETLEIVTGRNKGEAADAVFDKYAAQKIGFNVRPYTDPATMTPRAKLAKRIASQPGKSLDYNYEIVNQADVRLPVVDKFYATNDTDAQKVFSQWLKNKDLPDDTENYGYRQAATRSAEAEPSVAQNFEPDYSAYERNSDRIDAIRARQDATDVPRNWEFVNRINGQVIHNMTNASYNQANVVQTNLELRYPDADIYLRSVERPN